MLTRTSEKTLLRFSTLALTGYLLLMPGIAKSEEAKKEEPRKENIFAQGAFDTAVLDGNLPKDWWPNDKDKVTLEQEGKDRFLRITNDKPDATVYAVCRIPVKPEWKRLSISTRLAGKNLKVGVGKDPRAHLLVSFENAKKEWIGGGAYRIRLTEDSEWKPMGEC